VTIFLFLYYVSKLIQISLVVVFYLESVGDFCQSLSILCLILFFKEYNSTVGLPELASGLRTFVLESIHSFLISDFVLVFLH
jgi:hypothetical protein